MFFSSFDLFGLNVTDWSTDLRLVFVLKFGIGGCLDVGLFVIVMLCYFSFLVMVVLLDCVFLYCKVVIINSIALFVYFNFKLYLKLLLVMLLCFVAWCLLFGT